MTKFVRGFEPRLSYKSNHNLARHLVRAKLKNDTSQQSSSSDGSGHQPDTAEGQRYIANLAGITHNQDIGLKINTTRCKDDSKCPLQSRLICTNQIRSKISGRAFITRGKSNCNTESCLRHPMSQVQKAIRRLDLQITQKIYQTSTDIQTAICCQYPSRALQQRWVSWSGQHQHSGPADSKFWDHRPTS